MLRTTLTVKEAAEFIGVSKDLIYAMVRQNKMPCVKVGRRILFRKVSLETWMGQQENILVDGNSQAYESG